MASLRKLRRRQLRWVRYDNRTARHDRAIPPIKVPPGLIRAARRVEAEIDRRFWAETPEIWLGGPEGEAALIDDVLGERCCLTGEQEGHDGPCVVACDECNGDGRCPDCGGVDDLGCDLCDGSGSCPRGCDSGEVVVEEFFPARVSVETVTVAGGLL
ncbi:hypothetical protein [Paractinoplanes atraurantiacus]|uniref:Uncharacterized protein n=1 Tax=Paractinoplanes atraurantiacus TaxID=1036182 RepID=A0A285GZM7_9ACTN|nr:hypothetical protein [Actinoplanes atraurantiacus]SNY28957.1 hypothetical protein SAMN05421748_103165 [Actinoplanes atraurantiacus]